jgi:hypothetical protein
MLKRHCVCSSSFLGRVLGWFWQLIVVVVVVVEAVEGEEEGGER